MLGVYNAVMLTEKDLMLIGALIDAKLDARFDTFEERIERKFDEFAGVIKKSFDEVFLRLDRVEGGLNRIENHDDSEDHPSWK